MNLVKKIVLIQSNVSRNYSCDKILCNKLKKVNFLKFYFQKFKNKKALNQPWIEIRNK